MKSRVYNRVVYSKQKAEIIMENCLPIEEAKKQCTYSRGCSTCMYCRYFNDTLEDEVTGEFIESPYHDSMCWAYTKNYTLTVYPV